MASPPPASSLSLAATSRSHSSPSRSGAFSCHPLSDLIAPQLTAVDQLFTRELTSDLSNVNDLVTHVGKFRGKMLRPMLVLLSGKAVADGVQADQKAITDNLVTLATVVEMVHMATLVHDDILDGAEIRRKGATINHLHGNEAAVLLGDFLISHAYHLCSTLEHVRLGKAHDGQAGCNEENTGRTCASRLIAHTTNIVCEGELTQNFHRHNWELDEKTYFLIIYRKTAALTETCCRLGALFSTPNSDHVEALAAYGKKVGMAFQIVDDILDIVGSQKTVGKSLGTDIEKGKLTLPLIHFLRTAAPQHRELLLGLLESRQHDRVEHVRQLVAPSASIAYARAEAQRLIEQAIAALAILPDTPAREALTQAAHFVTAREK